jgi:chromosome segregation ATPase
MAGESQQYLQDAEKFTSHLMDLLTQADQDLQQLKTAIQSFHDAHNENQPHGTRIADAITDIENVLTQATNKHNEIVGQLKEAQAHAQDHAASDPGY